MKALATAASAALLITLAGCNQMGIGGGDANNSASNAAAGNASGGKDPAGNSAAPSADASGGKDPAGATQASSGAQALDRTYLVGRWTDSGDCMKAMEFGQDGTFRNADGTSGLWNLEGDQLTLTGSATMRVRVSPVDRNTVTVINADGSLGRSTRC